MNDRADILRFPGTLPPGSGELYDHGFDDYEDWEEYEELLKNEDYPGLVERCEREMVRHPEEWAVQVRLGEAYVLNGQYRKAIEAMGGVHRRFPDIESFQHLILDVLFAIGKTEKDYDWVRVPWVLRIGRAVLEECHLYLRPKRKPREVAELSFELMLKGYRTFSDEELLNALSEDGRFVIEHDRIFGWDRVRVRRKREDRTSACHEW